jgi:alkylation response protein AidB-like acyl-CoA dehydrogenase
MDITLNEDQTLLYDTALSFTRQALTPKQIRDLEGTEHGFEPAVWKDMAQMGWAAAAFPESFGGVKAGPLELALIAMALGQGAIPSPFFSTVVEAGLLLLDAGSTRQQSEWLPRIGSGETILTTAITEPGGGLLPDQIRTVIVPAGNGFRIDGTKLFVRDAGLAAAIVCLARSPDNPLELTLAMVPRNASGVSLKRLKAAGGESVWEVRFEGVMVNADAVVGEVGDAWRHVERLLRRAAAFKSAELVGIGQASIDLTLNYAKSRVQFSKPIGSFQAVQHHCANMYRDLEICRLLSWQAAGSLGEGSAGAAREVAIAKAKCSDAIPAATRIAQQIHGAIAYYRDYPLELYYHRAIAAQAAYGDAAHHRRTLARLLSVNMDRFRGNDRHDLPVHYV